MSTSSSHPETLDFYGISSSSEDPNDPEASLRSQDNRDDESKPTATTHRTAKALMDELARCRQQMKTLATMDAQLRMGSLSLSLRQQSHVVWAVLFKYGIMQLALDVAFDADLCGSPAAAMQWWGRSPQSKPYSMRYVAGAIDVLAQCFLRLCIVCTSKWRQSQPWLTEFASELNYAARCAIDRAPLFWERVYKFRETLLSEEYEAITYPADDGRNTCSVLAATATHILILKQNFNITFTHSPVDLELMLLVLFIRNVNQASEFDLEPLMTLRELLQSNDSSNIGRFYSNVYTEATTLPALNQCFRTFYRDEPWIDVELFSLFYVHASISNALYRIFPEVDAIDDTTVSHAFAACRRQICRGTSKEDTDRTLAVTLNFITPPLDRSFTKHNGAMPEWIIHAVVTTACMAFPDILFSARLGTEAPSVYLSDLIQFGTIAFQFAKSSPHGKRVSPALNMLRRHTLRRLKALLEGARVHPVHVRNHPDRDSLMAKWLQLQRTLPQPTCENLLRHTSIKRCAWEECCCSVYKPAHRMRVCTGCHTVAYCGEKCREKDWFEGGHKTRCRRLGR